MIISKTPLRISFFGGGTDFPEYFNYNDSYILGATINKFIYITFQEKDNVDEKKIKIFYKNNEFINHVSEINHNVIKLLLQREKVFKNFEMHICSDMPSYSGLGTSSAFTVGLKNLISHYKKIKINPYKLASFSIKFERNVLRETVGFQDQIHASYGGFNLLKLKYKNKFVVKKIINKNKIKKIADNLFLIYTNITRRASDIEKKKLMKLKKNYEILKNLNKLTQKALLIFDKDLHEDIFGDLLASNWELKKKLDDVVSNPAIDKIYETGISSGAIGGKLLGAGAGGFLLFYVNKKNHKKFRENMMKSYEIIDFQIYDKGSEVLKV